MHDDSDFAAYLAARWPRCCARLVLLGSPPARPSAWHARRSRGCGPPGAAPPTSPRCTPGATCSGPGRTVRGPPASPPGRGRRARAHPGPADPRRPGPRWSWRAVAGLDPARVALVLPRPGSSTGAGAGGVEAPGEADLLAAADELAPGVPGPDARGPGRGTPRHDAPAPAAAPLVLGL